MGDQNDRPTFVPLEWWDARGLSAEKRVQKRQDTQAAWAKRIQDWGLADEYGIPPARYIPGYGMAVVLERHDGGPVGQLLDGMTLAERLALQRGADPVEILGDRLPRELRRALHKPRRQLRSIRA